MKLSILTTISNPQERQDPYIEALQCYLDVADEVVIVDGSRIKYDSWAMFPQLKLVHHFWPEEWDWSQLPVSLNRGLEKCTGDWVLKLDIDQFIHQNDIYELKRRLRNIHKPCATFQKYSVTYNKRFYQKGEMITAINKGKYGDKISFGEDINENSDLCRPIWHDLLYNEKRVPLGRLIQEDECGRTGITIWNFDYTFKTQELTRKEFYRFAKAYTSYFDDSPFGSSEEESFQIFCDLHKGRYKKANYEITDMNILPKYIQHAYINLKPSQFGYNGWGIL